MDPRGPGRGDRVSPFPPTPTLNYFQWLSVQYSARTGPPAFQRQSLASWPVANILTSHPLRLEPRLSSSSCAENG
jgi:hypothetical protein